MPKPTKYNFVSPDTDSFPEVNCVSLTKASSIVFMKVYAKNFGLENKFVRFYVDTYKHRLGWVFAKSLDGFAEFKKSQYRPLRKCPANGVIQLSIKRILDKLGYVYPGKPARIPVDIYKDTYLGDVHHIEVPHKAERLYPSKIEVPEIETPKVIVETHE